MDSTDQHIMLKPVLWGRDTFGLKKKHFKTKARDSENSISLMTGIMQCVVAHLNLSRPARPLVVSSSGKRSRGRVSGEEQYLLRDSISSWPDMAPSSIKPLAQHTKPAESSSMGWAEEHRSHDKVKINKHWLMANGWVNAAASLDRDLCSVGQAQLQELKMQHYK